MTWNRTPMAFPSLRRVSMSGTRPPSSMCERAGWLIPARLATSFWALNKTAARGCSWGISSLALLGLVAEQGHAVPGAVGGNVAEGVAGEAGLPLTGQGEVGGQIADGVGGLGATTVAAQGDDEAPRFE